MIELGAWPIPWSILTWLFPKHRFSDELLAELQQVIPSQLTIEDDYIVIRHLYIERRV